jgi:hypothetical protein
VSVSETEGVAYIARLYEMEATRDYEPFPLVIGPYSLFILISAVQMALRHPDFGASDVGAQVRDLIGQLRAPFTGTPGEALLAAGDDPGQDVPRERKEK